MTKTVDILQIAWLWLLLLLSKAPLNVSGHEPFQNSERGPEARVIGKAKLISCENIARCFPPKSKSGANVPHFHPRHRRQIEEKSIKDNHDHDGTNLIHEIHIETPKVLLKHQKSGGTTINPIKIKLAQPEVPLLAPSYKLVVRGSQNSILSVNDTVPFPTCLYHGTIAGDPHSNVSISTCDGNNIDGVILAQDRQYVIESFNAENPEHNRVRRDTDFDNANDKDENLVLIYETPAAGGKCGLKSSNLWKMKAAPLEAVRLEEDFEEEFNRFKRNADPVPHLEKAVELAVFVDNDLYRAKYAGSHVRTIEKIQNFVYGYLGAVQLLYQSKRLDVTIHILMIRLEIHREPDEDDLDKKGGDIEGYLESFCDWQEQRNPDSDDKRSTNKDRWDHALLLTGLDLFDKKEEYSSVIGLAWVSGMCHPKYSCTINEGHNFESVFVIAHEMGHNLGMNHDGELSEGNACNENKSLMSPVLGPGKVTWSNCSNQELVLFLTQRATARQAVCLDDLPSTVQRSKNAYLKDGKKPGELINAYEQCQEAFGAGFRPHVKRESPFENLCRELWCANKTHALRAHPALEGTDCSAKPYPYGSFCIEGKCVPYFEEGEEPKDDVDNDIDADTGSDPDVTPKNDGNSGNDMGHEDDLDLIDGRPAWYEPIFLDIFLLIKQKVDERFNAS